MRERRKRKGERGGREREKKKFKKTRLKKWNGGSRRGGKNRDGDEKNDEVERKVSPIVAGRTCRLGVHFGLAS